MPASALMEMCPWTPAEPLTGKNQTPYHASNPNYNIFSMDAQGSTPRCPRHIISIDYETRQHI